MKLKLGRMFSRLLLVAVVVVIALVAYKTLAPRGDEPSAPVAGAPADVPASMSQGQYLTVAADCIACHTTPGGTPFAGGRAFKLPFGTIYSTNLTPDRERGIGAWSDDAFVDAVRKGIGSHGHLYPAMPYTSYAAMSRDDVLAIKSYLFTLEPVAGKTPENQLGFPFDQRWGMALWNLAFFDEHRFVADETTSASLNRGAYLATALGHCGECHTPRNIGMAMSTRQYLAGTVVEGWRAYNTTADKAYGIGDWSDEQLKGFLSRGHAPGRGSASGPMAEVVENSLQYLSPSDTDALVAYLRSVAPKTGKASDGIVDLDPAAVRSSNAVLPGNTETATADRGMRVFAGACAGCHQWDGKGRQTAYASLQGSHAVNDPSGMAIVQVLLKGTRITIDGRTESMPAFGDAYSDEDLAAVANHVLAHFGSKQGRVTAAQVAEQRKAL